MQGVTRNYAYYTAFFDGYKYSRNEIQEKLSKQNIFDLAGNVCEWTLEKTSYTSGPCSCRGGYSDGSGNDFPASDRGDSYPTYSGDGVGFRVALY